MRQREEIVEGIPVILVEPDEQRGAPVLWMSYLGGYGERNLPMLERFAAAGHPAASFDAPGHGARGSGDRQEFARHVLAAFRQRMWPLLGRTTLEALRVLDWLGEDVDASEGFLVGGFSMGGDAAVALAGIDQRVRRVAAQLDPMRHLDRFRRELAIDFELGAEDRHIPEANARAFADALAALDPPVAATVEINVHPGLDHGVVSDQAAKDAAFAFLLDPA